MCENKVPIAISPQLNIYASTHSPSLFECSWIFQIHIRHLPCFTELCWEGWSLKKMNNGKKT
ncbi:competence protein ComK [Anaerobacillus sp. HL2]|nr:competence protein ComK [Anaerobacillus sp. HL2]